MLLTVFVVAQIVFDVAMLLLFVLSVARRKPPAPVTAPPDWYNQLVGLAQDLISATEPVLDELERRPARRAEPPPEPWTRQREAMALLRAGVAPEEVARRGRLLPGELKLIRNVVAAEAQSAGSTDE